MKWKWMKTVWTMFISLGTPIDNSFTWFCFCCIYLTNGGWWWHSLPPSLAFMLYYSQSFTSICIAIFYTTKSCCQLQVVWCVHLQSILRTLGAAYHWPLSTARTEYYFLFLIINKLFVMKNFPPKCVSRYLIALLI